MEKENPSPAPSQKTCERSSARTSGASSKPPSSPRFDSFAGLQRIVGNQALLSLLNSPRIQTKSRSDAGDEFEAEADRAAELVVQRTPAPEMQRKCAGGDSCACAKCSGKNEQQRFSSTPQRIQRQAKDAKQPAGESAAETRHRQPRSHIVDDEAPSLAPGQMRKSAFLDRLEADVCATADAELAAAGRSTESCPYIEKWLAHYRRQSSTHIERALVKYASEATTASSANDYFGIVHRRVRQAVATWAKTGRITGVPPGVSMMPPSTGEDEKSEEGFGAGVGKTLSGMAKVLFKTRDSAAGPSADPEAVRSQLGSGRALESQARSRMESSFGHDFSGVRIHTDSGAASVSSQLNARAFTVGNDIGFATGEYRPGTLVGDALLAHELAHTVQQGGSSNEPVAQLKAAHGSAYNSLEQDADGSAIETVTSLWSNGTKRLGDVRRSALPRMRSGLRIQRCGGSSDKSAGGDKKDAGTPSPDAGTQQSAPAEAPKKLDFVLQGSERKPWRNSYDRESEVKEAVKRVKNLHIKVGEPAQEGKKKKLWTFNYFPLTIDEADAQAKAKQTELGKWYDVHVAHDNFVQSYFLEVLAKCPEGVPPKPGFEVWKKCLTKAEADGLVKRLRENKIEAVDPVPTESVVQDAAKQQFAVYFKPLTEEQAKAAGVEAAKARPGFAEGMFKVEAEQNEQLQSFVYKVRTVCPDGYAEKGTFYVTSYVVAKEAEFNPETVTDPCGLKGKYRRDFLYRFDSFPYGVKMEGSGKTIDGRYVQFEAKNGQDCFKIVDAPKTKKGTVATPGRTVAVDKSVIPLGSELLIEDVGPRTAEDIGGGIKGNEIDVYQPEAMTMKEANQKTYGAKKVCIKTKT